MLQQYYFADIWHAVFNKAVSISGLKANFQMFLAPNVSSLKCSLLSCNYGFSLMFPPAMGPIYMCHLLPRVTAQGAPVKLRMQAQLQAGACREVFFQELGDTRETKIKEDIFVIYLSLSLSLNSILCLFRHLSN